MKQIGFVGNGRTETVNTNAHVVDAEAEVSCDWRHAIEGVRRGTHGQIEPNGAQVDEQRPDELVAMHVVHLTKAHELKTNEDERQKVCPEVEHFVVVEDEERAYAVWQRAVGPTIACCDVGLAKLVGHIVNAQ